MKKIIGKIAFFSSILLAVTSCNKQLDLTPSDVIDASKAFTSVTDLEQALLGVYSSNNQTNKTYIGSILADEVKISNENRGQGQGQFKFQYSSAGGEHNADFSLYYVMLDRLHRVLGAVDNVKTNNDNETVRKNKVRAELLGLRGVAYYELLIRFMPSGFDPEALGVPLILESNVSAKPPRSKVKEVVAQIESDLSLAKAESTIQDGPTDVLHLSKAAIAAYQARLALLKKDYAAAITYANDAIALSGKSLAPRNSFATYWSDDNETETIWKYRNSATPQLLWRDANGDVFFEPSDKLKNQFNRATDIRFSTFFGSASGDTSIVTKYPGSTKGPQINDLKIIRVSEMYLLRSEAYAENNQLTLAANDLNMVRSARITGYTAQTFTTKAEAVDAIINERFKELCFEGNRFFDLKRKGLAVNRLATDVQSLNWQNLPANNFRFALPIPSFEILANPNDVQNTGY